VPALRAPLQLTLVVMSAVRRSTGTYRARVRPDRRLRGLVADPAALTDDVDGGGRIPASALESCIR